MDQSKTDDEAYAQLNKAWKSTCKVLLGDECGDLLEFRDYLKRYTDPIEKRKSALSGKDVTISSNRVLKSAPVMGYEEMGEYATKTADMALDIDEIKDIDSITRALGEKVCYAGNVVLGNSRGVVDSHRCINTFYALECQDVYEGKYTAFTTSIRNPEYSFGACFGGDIQFCIKVLDPYKQIRCMETFHCNVASDSYYSASLEDCAHCMFSFNQKNRQYLIGNVQLDRDKYAALKTKLTGEIAGSFRKNKSVPSIIDIIRGDRDG